MCVIVNKKIKAVILRVKPEQKKTTFLYRILKRKENLLRRERKVILKTVLETIRKECKMVMERRTLKALREKH